jgi:hypothetical protein
MLHLSATSFENAVQHCPGVGVSVQKGKFVC